jgi:hypothetical protein
MQKNQGQSRVREFVHTEETKTRNAFRKNAFFLTALVGPEKNKSILLGGAPEGMKLRTGS